MKKLILAGVLLSLVSVAKADMIGGTFPPGLTSGTTINTASGTITNFTTTQSTAANETSTYLNVLGTATLKNIVGVADGSNAPSGMIGESISSTTVATVNAPTSGNFGDIVSMSLTAGDWDVSFIVDWTANGATVTTIQAGISTTSGNSTTGLNVGINQVQGPGPVNGVTGAYSTIPSFRISLAAPATIFGKYEATYTVATPQVTGARLSARRVR